FPVKDVVAQNQARAGVANEFGADQKSLGNALWFRLFRILDFYSKLGTVAQEIPQHGQVFRCGNDQDIAQAAEHEGRERITDHRFVVNRKQLLADNLGDRKKPAAGAARKNDGLLCHRGSVIPSGVEESLTISESETSRDVSRSTRFARSGQALNMAAAPLLNGCNVTLPLDMTNGSGKPHVFARVHFEIQVERVSRVRFDDLLHELHENRVFPKNGELV